MNSHSIRTIGLLALMFSVAGLQALHDVPMVTQYAGIIDLIVPILLIIEHKLAGNTI